MLVLKLAATVAALAQGVFSEGVHLFNCRPSIGSGSIQTWTAIVAYCANDADCSTPSYAIPAENRCIMSTSSASGVYHIWEGSPQQCTFPSGVTFGWNIPSNAQAQGDYTSVGGGWNDFRAFTGYKDNKQIGAGYTGHNCTKIYYYV